MKLVRCKCGATSGPRRWLREGWCKFVTRFSCGSRTISYTCKACLDRNVAKWNAEKQSQEAAP